jgi:glycosyltransferase involved in cell wall biosynthesis
VQLGRLRSVLGRRRGWIDDVTLITGAAVSVLDVTGWCESFSEEPARVELRMDDQLLGRAGCHLPRPDVAAMLSSHPETPLGFRLAVRVPTDQVGPAAELGLYAMGGRRWLARHPVPPPRREAEPSPAFCGLDHPDDDAVVVGPVVAVSGWVLLPDGTARVEVEVQGVTARRAMLGLPRVDVSAVHPWTDAAGCGFSATIDVSDLPRGPRMVAVHAVDTLGSYYEIARRTVHLDAAPRPATGSTATRGTRPPRRDRGPAFRRDIGGGRQTLLVALPDGQYGGAQLRTLELVPELSLRFSVVVGVPADGPLLTAFRQAGARVEIVPDARDATDLDIVRRTDADVVLAETVLCDWAVRAADAAGVPSLFEVHESVPLPELLYSVRGGDSELAGAVQACRDALGRADVVVVPQDALAGDLERFTGRHPVVIPTGIDVAHFRGRLAAGRPRFRPSLRRAEPRLICVGTGAPHKGQAVLARALQLLGPGVARTTFVGLGQSSYVDAMVRDMWAAGLDPGVDLVPVTHDPAPWFDAADVLVCPSYTETFPGVLLEARVAGLEIVASDLPGTRSAAGVHPVTWVPAGDVGALAAALQQVITGGPASHASDPEVPDATERAKSLLGLLAALVPLD